jgi:uncharacterized membrane protein YphA (DoxX/SURF4 family)
LVASTVTDEDRAAAGRGSSWPASVFDTGQPEGGLPSARFLSRWVHDGDVNDQPPRQHPGRHGAASTGLAAHPTPPDGGAPGWRLWAATAARLLLAAVWAWAAVAKISGPDAAVRAVRAYQLLPEALVRPVAWGLPFAELVLALLLAVGLATRLAAAGSAVLLGLFMVAIASAWARGLQIHCGCFGGGGPATGVQARDYLLELVRDAGLLAVAALLAWRPHSRLALDRRFASEEP